MNKEDWWAMAVFIIALFAFGMAGALAHSFRDDTGPVDAGQPEDVNVRWYPVP